jgi:cell division protein YceG involved in septum cleavage
MLQRSTIVIIVLSLIVATEAGFIIWLALENKQHCKEQYKISKEVEFTDDEGVNALARQLQERNLSRRGGGRPDNWLEIVREANYV